MAHVELEAIVQRAKRLIQSNLDISQLLVEVIFLYVRSFLAYQSLSPLHAAI